MACDLAADERSDTDSRHRSKPADMSLEEQLQAAGARAVIEGTVRAVVTGQGFPKVVRAVGIFWAVVLL